MKAYRILFIILALLLALVTPALMRQAFPQAAAQSANSFAPSANKTELWHLRILRVRPSQRAEFISFVKHELNPARIKGGMQRMDYWMTSVGNTTEFINIELWPNGYADISQPGAVGKAMGAGANNLFERQARLFEELHSYVVRYEPTLSFTSAKFQGKPDWAIFNLHEIVPGREQVYLDWRKNEYIPVARQGHDLAHWMGKVTLGGDITRTFIEIRPLTSPAELDIPLSQEPRLQAVIEKRPAGTVSQHERRLVRYRPDISIFDGKPVLVAAN